MAVGIKDMAIGCNLPVATGRVGAVSNLTTVSALSVVDLHDQLCAMGVVTHARMRAAGLIRNAMIDHTDGALPPQEQRLPEAQLLALWRLAAANTAVPHIGLLVGQTYNPAMRGVLASLLSHCDDIGEVQQVFQRHVALMNPSERWVSAIEGESVVLTLSFAADKAYPQPALERSMSGILTWIRELTGLPVVPTACEFAFPSPRHRSFYPEIFGRRLHFDCDANRIHLPQEVLRRPIRGANSYLKQVLAERAQLALRKIVTESVFVVSVRDRIRSNLRLGLSIGNICKALNVSRPTLYRRLKREGTSYSELVATIRKELAYQQILQGMSVAAVSDGLGFKDVSTFHRACRRWFKQSPGDLRARSGMSF